MIRRSNTMEAQMTRTTSPTSRNKQDSGQQHAGGTKREPLEARSNPVVDRTSVKKKAVSKKHRLQVSKKVRLTKLLSRSRGASVLELEKALGWQPHSIRAAISGLRKSGLTVERTTTKSGPRYHICQRIDERPPTIVCADTVRGG